MSSEAEQQQEQSATSEATAAAHSWWSSKSHDFKSRLFYFGFSAFMALFLGLLFAQLLGFDRAAARQRETVVVFTDGDVDDLLALHYLMRRSDVAVPLVVVSGNGLASPRAALDNVRSFVRLCEKQRSAFVSATDTDTAVQEAWVKTRVVLGAALPLKDCGDDAKSQDTLRCTYRRFVRSNLAVRVGADTLYGESSNLKKLASSGTESITSKKTAQQEFSALVTSAQQSGNSLSLLVLGPATDAERVIRTAIPDQGTAQSVLRIVVMAGGKFSSSSSNNGGGGDSGASSSNSGVADASILTRNTMHEIGAQAELNFFADPEAANEIISGNVFRNIGSSVNNNDPAASADTASASSSPPLVVPVVVVPLDIAGSNAAYVDFRDQWAVLTRKNAGDVVQQFLASLLLSYSAYEGATFFPFKATPKSVAAVGVLLDRIVRNSLYTTVVDTTAESSGSSNSGSQQQLGVVSWNLASDMGSLTLLGRSGSSSGSTSSSSSPSGAVVEVALGFANGASPRIFMDSYLRAANLPWW